jgi:hypothetical protein
MVAALAHTEARYHHEARGTRDGVIAGLEEVCRGTAGNPMDPFLGHSVRHHPVPFGVGNDDDLREAGEAIEETPPVPAVVQKLEVSVEIAHDGNTHSSGHREQSHCGVAQMTEKQVGTKRSQ